MTGDARNIELEMTEIPRSMVPTSETAKSPISSQSVHFTPLPPIPLKIFALSVLLTVAGVVLLALGCVGEMRRSDPGNGLTFWLTGGLVFIPGAFYAVKLILAWRETDPEERMRILDDVPI